MGSINSRSQLPATPTYTSVSAPATTTSTTTSSEPVKTDAQLATEGRTDSLLRRSRGTLGTIFTSFKGFLTPSDTNNTNGRKTLLGE